MYLVCRIVRLLVVCSMILLLFLHLNVINVQVKFCNIYSVRQQKLSILLKQALFFFFLSLIFLIKFPYLFTVYYCVLLLTCKVSCLCSIIWDMLRNNTNPVDDFGNVDDLTYHNA